MSRKNKSPKKKAKIKAEKESEKQNALFLEIMDELCKMPFTWRLSSPWLYENGIYSEFDLKNFLAKKGLKDYFTPKIIEKIKLNLEIHSLRLEPKVFDNLVCLKNNVYDFITGEYEPHNKRYLFTYKFNEIGNSDTVRAFLGAFCDVPDKVGYFLGSCFFAHNEPEKCLFLIGDIGTGKSTLARCLSEIFPQNTTYINLAKNYVDRFEMFGLVDSRLNIMDDVYVNQHNFLNMQSLISGKVSVSTERKYGDPFTFKPQTKFLYTTNFDPIFSRECEGMKRRALFVHTKKCNTPPPIPSVADWLAYGLEFAKRLHNEKFRIPYAEEVVIYNPIKDFLEICEFPIPASEFYNNFVEFCHAEHGGLDKRFTSAVFYNEAKKCGFESKLIKKSGQVIRFWLSNKE